MRRHLKIAGGFVLLGVGAILSLPGVPGPGIVLMLAGLLILSNHFEWARRLLEWAKQRAARIRRNPPTSPPPPPAPE